MSRPPVYALLMLAAAAVFTLPARGQAVISTRSGVVHFFDGSVYVAGQPLESRLGKFNSVLEGGELRTEQGRAEVLLTPGVFLRVGEKSAIRMLANGLSDTRVELLAGSVMVESAEPAAGTSVTVIYKNWTVQQNQKGLYRMDCEPPRLQVREGEVQVSATGDAPVAVEQGMDLPLATVLVPERSTGETRDALSDWAEGRAESISADNQIASSIQDPASMSSSNLPADGFTYYPMLGLSTLSYGVSSPYSSGLYGTVTPYQAGFYSMYLPGYTYQPLFFRLPLGALPGSLYSPFRTSLPGSTLTHLPGSTLPRTPIYTLPHPVVPHPATPVPAHPAVHPVGHR